MARVITWTKRDGIMSVTDVMPEIEAKNLADTLREANPSWLRVEVEIEPQIDEISE